MSFEEMIYAEERNCSIANSIINGNNCTYEYDYDDTYNTNDNVYAYDYDTHCNYNWILNRRMVPMMNEMIKAVEDTANTSSYERGLSVFASIEEAESYLGMSSKESLFKLLIADFGERIMAWK